MSLFQIIIVFFIFCQSSSFQLNKTAAYIEGEEFVDDLEALSPPYATRSPHNHVPTSYSSGYQGDQNLCPAKTFCSSLSECRLLTDLMDRSCLLPARLKELTCGYLKNELMVCCPNGANTSPFRPPGNWDDNHDSHNQEPDKGQGLNQACGKPQLNGWQSGYTGLGSHPWIVRVGFKNSDTGQTEYPCCGSLITPSVVLTAAHCAVAKSVGRSLASVRVGDYDMRTDPDCTTTFCAHPAQTIPVSSVVVHPGYEKSTFRHDVALIMLKTPANMSLGVQPICLLQSATVPLVGTRATLIGYGKLPDQDTVSPRQHQLQLPIVSLEVCSRIYDRVIRITSNHLCVGGEAKKDACSGFGGAPLVILDPVRRDRYIQVAMVSFGSDKCGAPGVPSVYTNIQEYFTWIKTNLP